MAIDIIREWLSVPRVDYGKPFDPKKWVTPKSITKSSTGATFHLPMTDSEAFKKKKTKENDKKGINTPIEDYI